MPEWILTVGIEAHVQLKTKTKMFCGCKNDPFASAPNSNVCPVCYGLPGALPVINRHAIELVIEFGQAISAKIAQKSFWARKNYFYPDLPKGYQISQSSMPLIEGGVIAIDGTEYHLDHAHLEEDAGKLIHETGKSYSLVDYNRAGTPLLEIVTEPDFHSATSAKRFCQELQRIMRHLEVSDADMEKGQMRCEANISVAPTNPKSQIPSPKQTLNPNNQSPKLGTKVEVKNINSFRSVERAIEYEFERQCKALEDGEKIIQETRTWSDAKNITTVMRTKETSADYRYFPEPDLPVVEIGNRTASKRLLPDDRRKRLTEMGAPEEIARTLVDKNFDEIVLLIDGRNPKLSKDAAHFLLEIPEFSKLRVDDQIILLEHRQSEGWTKDALIKIARELLSGKTTEQIISKEPKADLEDIATQVINSNPDPVAHYKSGKENALNFLVGRIMAETQGRANVSEARAALEKLLNI